MKTIKVSEATNVQLDWLVAKIQFPGIELTKFSQVLNHPSTNWAQGGPIIEREKIATQFWVSEDAWEALIKGGFFASYGPTPLIAAMRAYVASKLGDEVEVPDELLGEQP